MCSLLTFFMGFLVYMFDAKFLTSVRFRQIFKESEIIIISVNSGLKIEGN